MINEIDKYRLKAYSSEKRSELKFTNDEIETALRKAAEGKKGPLAREAYQVYYEQNDGVPHSYTVIRRYGKWNAALKAAGLPVSKRTEYKSTHDKGSCVRAIIAARDILGHLPSTGEYAQVWGSDLKFDGHPSASTIRSKYGKWRTAITEASQHI